MSACEPASLAMTAVQRRQLNEWGFVVLESFFQGEELDALLQGAGELEARLAAASAASTDGVPAVNEVDGMCLDLIDHPRILPYVVDAMGWNIHARDCLFTVKPPRAEAPGDRLGLAWHFDQEEEFNGVTQDGMLPLVELKVSYYLSDHSEDGHACTLVVPGSHRWTPAQRASWEEFVRPEDVVPLRVPIGSVLLWRSSILHSVAPHCAGSTRKHLFISYIPRFMRPSHRGNFSTTDHPDPARNTALLASSSPVRRQLLGAMGDLSPPIGSHFWFPRDKEQLPLKAWAEGRMQSGQSHRWGCTGNGVSFSRVLFGRSGSVTAGQEMTLPQRLESARVCLDSESAHFTRMQEGLGYRNLMNTDMQPEFLRKGAWKGLVLPPLPPPPPAPASSAADVELRTENERLAAENAMLLAKIAQLT